LERKEDISSLGRDVAGNWAVSAAELGGSFHCAGVMHLNARKTLLPPFRPEEGPAPPDA